MAFAPDSGRPDEGLASRYLVPDLPPPITEADLRTYFSALWEVEEVSIKELANGRGGRTGSVKFRNPSIELRGLMLKENHMIGPYSVQVMTWKMQKKQNPRPKSAIDMQVPGFRGTAGMAAQQRAARSLAAAVNAQASPNSIALGGAYGAAAFGVPYGGATFGAGAVARIPGPGKTPGTSNTSGAAKRRRQNEAKNLLAAAEGGIPPVPKEARVVAAGRGTDDGITSRYILSQLPEGIAEDTLRAYFGTYGDIEDVHFKHGPEGQIMSGSVKFRSPTMELRAVMLDSPHSILGQQIVVQTWKMRKKTEKAAGGGADGEAPARGPSRRGQADDAAGEWV